MEGMVDIFRIVTPKIVCEVPQKEPRIPDGTFINLDETFRECALMAFNTPVDSDSIGIRPAMEAVLVVEICIEVALEFGAMVGLCRVTRLYKKNGQNFIVRFNRRTQGMPGIGQVSSVGSPQTVTLGGSMVAVLRL